MARFAYFSIFFLTLISLSLVDAHDNQEFAILKSSHPISVDVVLAVDTVFYGYGDRKETDVSIDALLPFLRYFTEIMWIIPGRVRLAIVEMAKESKVLVELREGTTAAGVVDTFVTKKERRLSWNDRQSTTHIYRMITLVNDTVCNRKATTEIPCLLILMTVQPKPTRVPFVGADWPNWRILGDALIRSAFNLGIDVVILATGYHDANGPKPAGLVEMSRVEGKFLVIIKASDEEGGGEKIDWNLSYWQAPYDKTASVDVRVAMKTATIIRLLLSKEEPGTGAGKSRVNVEEVPGVEEIGSQQGYKGLWQLIFSISIAVLVGYGVKFAWHHWNDEVPVRGHLANFLYVYFINIVFIVLVWYAWWFFAKL